LFDGKAFIFHGIRYETMHLRARTPECTFRQTAVRRQFVRVRSVSPSASQRANDLEGAGRSDFGLVRGEGPPGTANTEQALTTTLLIGQMTCARTPFTQGEIVPIAIYPLGGGRRGVRTHGTEAIETETGGPAWLEEKHRFQQGKRTSSCDTPIPRRS